MVVSVSPQGSANASQDLRDITAREVCESTVTGEPSTIDVLEHLSIHSCVQPPLSKQRQVQKERHVQVQKALHGIQLREPQV